jgi:hypothetical protein
MKLKEKISFITTFENGVIKQTQYSILTLLNTTHQDRRNGRADPKHAELESACLSLGSRVSEYFRPYGAHSHGAPRDLQTAAAAAQNHKIPGPRNKDGSDYDDPLKGRDGRV